MNKEEILEKKEEENKSVLKNEKMKTEAIDKNILKNGEINIEETDKSTLKNEKIKTEKVTKSPSKSEIGRDKGKVEKTVPKFQSKNDFQVKSKKNIILVLGILIVILLILVVPIGIFCVTNSFNENIVSGVKINDIEVSNMSKEEAKNILSKYVEKKMNKNISLVNEEYEVNITPEQAGISFNEDEAVDEAYEVGRLSNIFANNLSILRTKLDGKTISLNINIDENKFTNLVNQINGSISNGIEQPNYYINESELVITSGKEGKAVNQEELKKVICSAINSNEDSNEKVEIPVTTADPEDIDLDSIYNEIHKEAQDAYVTKEPFELHPQVDGIDFAISMDEAKKILQEEKEEYKIPLKIIKPSVTTESLGDEAFPNVLATYSTKFSTADTNRTTNIIISVNKINGVVLMPGEEFSYNKILGPRTPQAGYKLGAAYIGGKVVSDYGGGVCQTSSTLYNSVLLSNLEVTSRTSHYFAATYVPIGRDATVYWPSLDFKFKNNRNYPIKIKASVVNGTITVDIVGVKEESDYEVELDSHVTGYVPCKVEYRDDNTLPEGKEVVEQAGVNGTKSETYKILKKDGKVISKTLISRDTYSGKDKIVRRGTKKVVQETKDDGTKSENNNQTQKNNEDQSNTQTNNNNQSNQQNTNQNKSKSTNNANNNNSNNTNNNNNKNQT